MRQVIRIKHTQVKLLICSEMDKYFVRSTNESVWKNLWKWMQQNMCVKIVVCNEPCLCPIPMGYVRSRCYCDTSIFTRNATAARNLSNRITLMHFKISCQAVSSLCPAYRDAFFNKKAVAVFKIDYEDSLINFTTGSKGSTHNVVRTSFIERLQLLQ